MDYIVITLPMPLPLLVSHVILRDLASRAAATYILSAIIGHVDY